MIEDKIKERITRLRQREDAIRAERQTLEARLFELNAEKRKKTLKERENQSPATRD